MKCVKCQKEYETYPEAKACYDSHDTTEPTETIEAPTLDALKGLLKQRSEPIRRIQPKQILEGETAPTTIARKILELAKDNSSFNGVGRITLAEARFALQDSSLQLKDIIDLLTREAPTNRIEQRPGNLILIYFNTTVTAKRVHIIDQHEETIKRLTNAKFTGL